jgi:hypothetical protein
MEAALSARTLGELAVLTAGSAGVADRADAIRLRLTGRMRYGRVEVRP